MIQIMVTATNAKQEQSQHKSFTGSLVITNYQKQNI